MTIAWLFRCAILAIFCWLGGCGYHFQRKEFVPTPSKAWGKSNNLVFVPVVDNKTTLSGIESVMTSALRESLASVRGIRVAQQSKGSRYFLLATITKYERRASPSVKTGDRASEERGGLIRGQSTAADIHLSVRVQVEMVEGLNPGGTARRLMWSRSFDEKRTYQVFERFEEAAGSASAPHVNLSREELKYRELAQIVASKVMDQMVQDF